MTKTQIEKNKINDADILSVEGQSAIDQKRSCIGKRDS